MNIDERKLYAYNKALDMLKDDEELFVAACDELDSWDGFLGDDRVYSMYDFNELMSGKAPLDIVDMINGDKFSTADDYFYYTIYGIESTDSAYDVYSSNYGALDVLDELIEKYNHVYLAYNFPSFDEIMTILFEEDYGIDEESDEEFKERIDAI